MNRLLCWVLANFRSIKFGFGTKYADAKAVRLYHEKLMEARWDIKFKKGK